MNYHSEKEVKQKWCPEVKFAGASDTTHFTNRDYDVIEMVTSCMGSACMQWVWQDEERKKGRCGRVNLHHDET